jgi:hypothetical protein
VQGGLKLFEQDGLLVGVALVQQPDGGHVCHRLPDRQVGVTEAPLVVSE